MLRYLLALALALPTPALADIAPSPERPDWNDPPAPLPPPPDVVVAAALGLAALGAAWGARRVALSRTAR